jgi:hypothetical protein
MLLSPQQIKEKKDAAKKNPVLRMRLELQPTEIQKRLRVSGRAKGIPHLTQRELARMFDCNISTIQVCERDGLWPKQLSLKKKFKRKYWELFGDDDLNGVHKELLFDDDGNKPPIWA